MEYPVIIYGAGGNATKAFEHLTSVGIMPVCFCDGDNEKIGKTISLYNPYGDDAELSILSIEDALGKYPDAKLYISPNYDVKWQIIDGLTKKGILKAPTQILNKEKDVVKGCVWTDAFEMFLNIDTNSVYNSICCMEHTKMIKLGSNETPVDDDTVKANIQKYFDRRDEFRAKGGFELCKNCISLTNVKKTDTINRIALEGHGVCQFKCQYCFPDKYSIVNTEYTYQAFVKYYNELEKQGKIADDFTFSVALGEITVNPIADKYLDFVIEKNGDKRKGTQINSNCAVYSEKIDYLLKTGGYLIVSIDAGTRETFKAVHGLDVYEKVLENTRKYICSGPVYVKYLFTLDGSNSIDADIDGFVSFIKEAKPICVMISSDGNGKSIQYNEGVPQNILNSMVRLVKSLKDIQYPYMYAHEFISTELMNYIEKEAAAS